MSSARMFWEARKDQQHNEMLGRKLSWTDDGVEYEAHETRRQALLKGVGLNDGSQMVSSTVVKTQEIDPKEDGKWLEARGATMFRSLAAMLKYTSMDRSDVQCAAAEIVHRIGEALAWKLVRETQERREIFDGR